MFKVNKNKLIFFIASLIENIIILYLYYLPTSGLYIKLWFLIVTTSNVDKNNNKIQIQLSGNNLCYLGIVLENKYKK